MFVIDLVILYENKECSLSGALSHYQYSFISFHLLQCRASFKFYIQLVQMDFYFPHHCITMNIIYHFRIQKRSVIKYLDMTLATSLAAISSIPDALLQRKISALIGSIVADAASLHLEWVYDQVKFVCCLLDFELDL